ncbi:MAG: uncharacterized membrane protein YuzA (DUF378 family) [Candidatus Krumholzibacteriia bacterium]|jgi:uncharacterized membrane protein YuzA (DUF378 family)
MASGFTIQRERTMKKIDVLAAVLLVIGGLNWGLWGAFKFDLVASLLGGVPFLMNTVYVLVGVSALYQGLAWKKIQLRWAILSPMAVRNAG